MKSQLLFNTSESITGKRFTFRATPELKPMQLLTEADKQKTLYA